MKEYIKPIILQVNGDVSSIILQYINLLIPIIILIIVSVFIGLIIDRVSRDRVIKLFKNNWVVLFYEDIDKNGLKEAYFGKIKIPARSGGGFELEYGMKSIVNPERLIGYLKRAYDETRNKKYLDKAKQIFIHLKEIGKIDKEFDDIRYDPFSKASEASKKIYKDNIKDIYAIVRFLDDMDEDEVKKRLKELNKIFHPGILYRGKRSVINFLGLAKDKLSDAIGVFTSTMSKTTPIKIEKEVKRAGETMVSRIGSYEALLETSIGKLVTAKVQDVDGVERYYQGILREYSPNYIAVYNVDFRINEEAVYIRDKLLENYPTEKLDFHGWELSEPQHLKIEDYNVSKGIISFKLRNIYRDYIYINKITLGEKFSPIIRNSILKPGEKIDVNIKIDEDEIKDYDIKIDYIIIKKCDVIWPTSKVKVIGDGEPSEGILEDMLRVIKSKL